jgi:hypothetical protein
MFLRNVFSEKFFEMRFTISQNKSDVLLVSRFCENGHFGGQVEQNSKTTSFFREKQKHTSLLNFSHFAQVECETVQFCHQFTPPPPPQFRTLTPGISSLRVCTVGRGDRHGRGDTGPWRGQRALEVTVSPGIEPGYIVFPSHKNNV